MPIFEYIGSLSEISAEYAAPELVAAHADRNTNFWAARVPDDAKTVVETDTHENAVIYFKDLIEGKFFGSTGRFEEGTKRRYDGVWQAEAAWLEEYVAHTFNTREEYRERLIVDMDDDDAVEAMMQELETFGPHNN